MKVNRFRFLSTVDTVLLALFLWAFLLVLPTFSMGGTLTHNRLIGLVSPTTKATCPCDPLDRRVAKTVDGKTVDGKTEGVRPWCSAVNALGQHSFTRKPIAIILHSPHPRG